MKAINKVTNVFNSARFKAATMALALSAAGATTALADGDITSAVQNLTTSTINTVFAILGGVMGLTSVFVLVPGVSALVESNQSGSPEQKSNGIKGIVTGLALAAATVVVVTVLKSAVVNFLSTGLGIGAA